MSEKFYRVLSPNANFNGWRIGVHFTNGIAMATKKQAQVLVANWKYSCPELTAETTPAESVKPESNVEVQSVGEAPASDKPSKDERTEHENETEKAQRSPYKSKWKNRN